MDKFRDECGVFGIFGHPEAAHLTYLGLYALQHRGQESAGIACADGHRVLLSRAMGEVNECGKRVGDALDVVYGARRCLRLILRVGSAG